MSFIELTTYLESKVPGERIFVSVSEITHIEEVPFEDRANIYIGIMRLAVAHSYESIKELIIGEQND